MRCICSVMLQDKVYDFGFDYTAVELGIVSLGTSTSDGSKKSVKVSWFWFLMLFCIIIVQNIQFKKHTCVLCKSIKGNGLNHIEIFLYYIRVK